MTRDGIVLLWGIGFVDAELNYLTDPEFHYAVKVTVMRELYEQKKIRRQIIYELWQERSE